MHCRPAVPPDPATVPSLAKLDLEHVTYAVLALLVHQVLALTKAAAAELGLLDRLALWDHHLIAIQVEGGVMLGV